MSRAFKSRPAVRTTSYRKSRATAGAAAARARVVGAQRGYLRTGGYYGRFRGRRAYSGSELKFLDTVLAPTVALNTGNVNPNIVVIPQGDGESERVGRKVVIKSIYFRGLTELTTAASVTDADDVVRIIVVQDKQANGAAFAVTDYLQTADFQSHRNMSNISRFRTLADFQMTMNATAALASDTCESNKLWTKYMKCNIPMEYDNTATSGAISTQRSNSVAVLMISQQQRCDVSYTVRIRYSDS